MGNYYGLKSYKIRAFKFQMAAFNNLRPTKALSTMSTDYSEPECEIHPSDEPCDELSIGSVAQYTRAPVIQKMSNDSLEEAPFHDQPVNTPYCDDDTKNKALDHGTKWNQTPRGMFELSNDFMNDLKPVNIPTEIADEMFESHYHLQIEKDRRDTAFDDSSSLREFEDTMFSIPMLDATAGIEDDISICFNLEGTESEIQVAVSEIRKEAEKIDTILVLDRLKTLQIEFDSISKKFSLRTMENEELKMQIHSLQNKVAQMELERDLHLADAAKLQEDLKTLVSKMFDISMYESPDLVDESIVAIKERINTCQSGKSLALTCRPSATSHHKNNSVTIIAKNRDPFEDGTKKKPIRKENIRILGVVDQPQHAVRQLPPSSDPGAARVTSCDDWSRLSETGSAHLQPSHSKAQTRRDQNVFRIRDNYPGRLPRTNAIRVQREDVDRDSSNRKGKELKRTILHRRKSLSGVDTHVTSLVTETFDDAKESEKKRCKLLFRCRSKQRPCSKEDVSILKQQINQLKETMRTSLTASEKLRKRLKVTTRYYEDIIGKLQTKFAETKLEKSRALEDLANTISQVDVERRLEKSKHEYELRRKDKEIERLKAAIDRGEI